MWIFFHTVIMINHAFSLFISFSHFLIHLFTLTQDRDSWEPNRNNFVDVEPLKTVLWKTILFSRQQSQDHPPPRLQQRCAVGCPLCPTTSSRNRHDDEQGLPALADEGRDQKTETRAIKFYGTRFAFVLQTTPRLVFRCDYQARGESFSEEVWVGRVGTQRSQTVGVGPTASSTTKRWGGRWWNIAHLSIERHRSSRW